MESLLASSSTILAVTAISLSMILYYRYSNIYSFWKNQNVPGPRPIFFVGHFLHIYFDCKTDFTRKCKETYGRVFGIFEAQNPILAIVDAELVVQICIKDFDAFPNHHSSHLFSDFQKKFIFTQQDNQWRRLRALLSPAFTSGKMRKMTPLLDRCVDDLNESIGEQIDEKSSAKINLKDIYSLYTMDTITTCCYAIKLERIKSVSDLKTMATRNQFVSDAMRLFQFDVKRMVVTMLLPEKLRVSLNFELFPLDNIKALTSKVSKLIESRRKSEKKFDDFFQSLIDSKLEEKMDVDDLDAQENHHAALTNESIRTDQQRLVSMVEKSHTSPSAVGFLDEEEIVSNASLLISVGLETTSTLLTSCTYALAHHQNIQSKLRDEIKLISNYNERGELEFDYAAVTSCIYLDAVLSETLRAFPVVAMVDRVCNRDYLIDKYNVKLTKGSRVSIQIKTIMTDPEYWPEPQRFDPERFMPQNRHKIVPGSYIPFGIGPRHCLGMRFSLTEAKLALAKVIMKYQFKPAPGASYPPKIEANFTMMKFESPVVLVERVV